MTFSGFMSRAEMKERMEELMLLRNRALKEGRLEDFRRLRAEWVDLYTARFREDYK